jgi:hypothetical protein
MRPWLCGVLLTLASCQQFEASAGPREEAWFRYARAYIEADREMAQHADSPKSLDAWRRRDEVAGQFRSTTPPAGPELHGILDSPSAELKTTGTVAALLSRNQSPEVVDRIVRNLRDAESYELKRYSWVVLRKSDASALEPYSDGLVDVISRETDERLVTEALPLVVRFPPERSVPVLRQVLRTPRTTPMKVIAYGLLQKLGPEYAARGLDDLERVGDQATLEAIKTGTWEPR